MSMDIDRMAALEMRVKALEADAGLALRRTLELSRLMADLSGTVRALAELGAASAEQQAAAQAQLAQAVQAAAARANGRRDGRL